MSRRRWRRRLRRRLGSHRQFKEVGRARVARGVVVFVGTNYNANARDRHGDAKVVLRSSVACDEEREFRPRGTVVLGVEEVDRARAEASAFDIAHGSDCDDAGRYRHGDAELVVRIGVGGRQLGHLVVRGAAVARAEDVDRAREVVVA